ncbi:Conserved oligomeric Golgi complex subunit 3 [Schistosoma japonicum]|nr:Conserved oligomeric Golgi complex subunit 3 [Schistosoma japonicum]KAH8869087.1 Conserved oligomeric Golgi complex subunit 3 [Schistosoma japonicum]
MSVITWDHVDNQQTILTEKQLESVFLLNSLNSVHEETTISNSDSPNITTTTITDQFDKCEDHITQNNDISIHTASHFYSWLWSVEQNLSAEIPKVPSEFLTFISRRKCECSKVLNIVEEILSKLSTLENNYLSISQSTNELHELCEHLLKQQNEMIEYANSIEDSLVNFVQVDMIQAVSDVFEDYFQLKELKVSNFVVSHEKLLPMLNKLDSSLIYFRDHPDFKESPNYLIKVKSSLKIALDHIKAHVTNIIGRTINELLELHDVISPENSFILLYGRFRSQGPKIRSLMTLLEDRVHVTDEYAHVIQECHKFYLHHREELLTPIAQNGVSDLVQKYRGDHCALLRTAGAFMVHMCEDEMRFQMLQKLCRCLYDAVRPLIIHINHVEILSELCDILKYELLQYDDPQKTITNSPDMMAFTDLCSMLLADIQERLVFRAHIYIKSQIFGFVPSPGDLSYPEKLEMMNDIAESISVPTNSNNSSDQKNESAESEAVTSGTDSSESNQQKASTTSDLVIQPGPNMSLAPADLHGMWYPTVRRTLVCLSKLSRCLDANSFRGLAQECVSMCVLSLVKASESISLRRTTIDGQLFLIKHLLILREQMVPFGIEFLVKETSLDFSPYKNVARSIWEHKGSGLFSLTKENALLRFLLETPNAIDIELDSRRQLDSQLKYTCELLIEQQIMLLTGEIPNFLKRAHSILAAPGARLADQPFASVSYIKEIISNAHRLLCSALGRSSNRPDTTIKHHSVPNLRKCLHIYLANPDTENILLRRIQSGVISQWRSMFQLLTDHYNDEDRMIIGCPTESQIRLLFQDICNRPVLVSS